MNYEESVRYLLTLGRELASPQQASVAKFDLLNITALCSRLGQPQTQFSSVHIAGTNGKGSTAALIESILRTAGSSTGLFTSPHLEKINERIRVNGVDISDQEFAATFTVVQRAIEELLANAKLAAHPTFFECITAMAFHHFARSYVRFAVCEVGMGGRLDATNILVPGVAVITQIDLDHENYLGHSIEEIAAEKAGIIKHGAQVVSATENPAAREVIRQRCVEQRATLLEIDNEFQVEDVISRDGCYAFTAVSSSSGIRLPVSVPLPGKFQIRNALAAIAAARLLGSRLDSPNSPIENQAISRGIAATQWPGRLERVATQPDIYFDGAHNPAGAREVVAFWEVHLAGRNIVLIYGAMRDKAVDEVAGLLFPRASTVILTSPSQSRAISTPVLLGMTGHHANRVEVVPSPFLAFDRALQLASPGDVIFVTGSLYLVGDLRHYWNTHHRIPIG